MDGNLSNAGLAMEAGITTIMALQNVGCAMVRASVEKSPAMAAPKPDFVELFSFMLGCHKTSDLPSIQEHYAASPPGFTPAEKERWKLKRRMIVEEIERRKPKSKKK